MPIIKSFPWRRRCVASSCSSGANNTGEIHPLPQPDPFPFSLPRSVAALSGGDADAARQPPPPEYVVILPSELLEISFSPEEDAIILAPSSGASHAPSPSHAPAPAVERVVIRYQHGEPGNIAHGAWAPGALQVSRRNELAFPEREMAHLPLSLPTPPSPHPSLFPFCRSSPPSSAGTPSSGATRSTPVSRRP
jgi:hypothetical protein